MSDFSGDLPGFNTGVESDELTGTLVAACQAGVETLFSVTPPELVHPIDGGAVIWAVHGDELMGITRKPVSSPAPGEDPDPGISAEDDLSAYTVIWETPGIAVDTRVCLTTSADPEQAVLGAWVANPYTADIEPATGIQLPIIADELVHKLAGCTPVSRDTALELKQKAPSDSIEGPEAREVWASISRSVDRILLTTAAERVAMKPGVESLVSWAEPDHQDRADGLPIGQIFVVQENSGAKSFLTTVLIFEASPFDSPHPDSQLTVEIHQALHSPGDTMIEYYFTYTEGLETRGEPAYLGPNDRRQLHTAIALQVATHGRRIDSGPDS